jgi:tRNA threonylcarbamoyladenosine biosynthesis protein TsaB
MLILTIRTDKPEAEVGLYDDERQLDYQSWQAHRELAETIHKKIREVLARHSKELHGLKGIVVFKGPGSFTGLRIGISVANALAEGLKAGVVATNGNDWRSIGIEQLLKGKDQSLVLPEYGSEAHTSSR